MSALKSRLIDIYRQPASKPKPNTRFLRTIIKETDNHNAALLAKEAAESKARLEKLETREIRAGADIRKRQLGLIAAHLTGRPSKTRRTDGATEGRSSQEETSTNNASPKRQVHVRRHERTAARNADDSDIDERSRHRSHKRHRSRSGDRSERKRYHRSSRRSRSPKEKEPRNRHRSPHLDRINSPHHRSRHAEDDDEPETGRHRHRTSHIEKDVSRRTNQFSTERPAPLHQLDEDSDPLEDIIGPRPPAKVEVRSRGRGIISAVSSIDSRFASNYDPALDVEIDPGEENDWDQALEAFRDRVKWKQQGADRLRAAGFTEDEIQKWEKGGEKREEDVRWAKKGESREWDRGKIVDGVVDDVFTRTRLHDESWGRLKDT